MDTRPNILLLTTDQQRYDTIAAAGYPHMVTPNLDRLVREGCLFSHAFSPNPACIPARHSIISGQYSAVHNLADNYFDGSHLMPRHIPTMAGCLSDAGYETVAVGKMHFLPTRNHNGFGRLELMEEIPQYREDDDYARYLADVGEGAIQSLHGVRSLLYMLPQRPLQEEGHTGTNWVADRLIHHIGRSDGSRPFFYWGSWIAPHPPLSVPARYADLYAGKPLPGPIPPARAPMPHTVENARIGDWYDEAVARRARECYYGAISHVDAQIGRVLRALEESGKLERTLILFTSDHGELLGDHGSFQKLQPYEGSTRIPMVMRWPGRVEPGSRYDGFVDLCDLLPTFLEAAGVRAPPDRPLPGASLLTPGMGGRDRTCQYIEYGQGVRRWISVRTEGYRYSYYFGGGLEELYDLAADPWETVNLAGSEVDVHREEKKLLRARLLRWEAQWGHAASIRDGEFTALERPDFPPRLPVGFPQFSTHLSEGERRGIYAFAQEVAMAIEREPTVRVEKLDWRRWTESALIDRALRNEIFRLTGRETEQE